MSYREADTMGDKKAFDFDRHHPLRSAPGERVSAARWETIFGKRKGCYHPKYLRRDGACGRCGKAVGDGG